MATALPAPSRTRAHDIGAPLPAALWRLPDGGRRAQAGAFRNWTLEQCLCRTAKEEWGGRTASPRFQFGRRPPLSDTRAGRAPGVRFACRKVLACPVR